MTTGSPDLVVAVDREITGDMYAKIAGVHARIAVEADAQRKGLPRADVLLAFQGPRHWRCLPVGLSWIHTASADPGKWLSWPGASALVTDSRGVATQAVAEHALAMLLVLTRDLPTYNSGSTTVADLWACAELHQRARRLQDLRVVVLGLGRVGRRVAALLTAFGASVVAVNRTAAPVHPAVTVHPISRMRDALRSADAVIVCLPANSATTGLVGERELALLATGSHLVNVGRAHVVDRDALVSALQSGQLRSAYCDVWYDEPPVAVEDHRSLLNLHISAHSAWRYPHHDGDVLNLFVRNLASFIVGGVLENVALS